MPMCHVIATPAIRADLALFASLTSATPPMPSRAWTGTSSTGVTCALTMRVTSDPTPCHVVATVADVVVVVDAVALAREAVHADAAPDHAHEAALVDAVAVALPAAREADHAPDRAHAVVAAHDHAREADPDRQLTRNHDRDPAQSHARVPDPTERDIKIEIHSRRRNTTETRQF